MVKGVRRIGKSSLIRVGLSLHGNGLHLVLDARSIPVLSTDTVYDLLARSLTSLMMKTGLRAVLSSALARVEGISISGVQIGIRRRRPDVLVEIAEALGEAAERTGKKLVLVFDEAQDFRVVPGFTRMLAHIYDYIDNAKIVLAGSEVGLLDKLLGRNNPSAPLYGRAFLEIEMKRLSREASMDFLVKGFEELGLKWPREYIEEAVGSLNGIPGWLTSYGYYSYVYRDHRRALEKTLEEGASIVRSEIERFLANRVAARTRYLSLLRCLSLRDMRWTELKTCLETSIGKQLNKSQFNRYVRELRDYGFVEKRDEYYTLADPLIRHAVTRY